MLKILEKTDDLPTLEDIKKADIDLYHIEELSVRCSKMWDSSFPFTYSPFEYRFCGATNGRLIGVYNKPSSQFASHTINFYNHHFQASGEAIELPFNTKNAFFYINSHDHVIVINVLSNGKVTCDTYFHGVLISQIPIPELSEEIVDAYFWDTGCVLATRSNEIWYLPNYKNPHILTLIVSTGAISKVRAIPCEYTKSSEPIIFAYGSEPVLYIGNSKGQNAVPTKDQITFLEFSKKYEYVGILFADNTLMICTSNLQDVYCKYTIEEIESPFAFGWLEEMILIGDRDRLCICTGGETVETIYIDGVPLIFSGFYYSLVFTNTECYKISVVPDEFVRFIQESKYPARLLTQAFMERNGNAIISIQEDGNLREAIEGCIKIANDFHNDTKLQKLFLFAAAFGNTFLNEEDSLKYEISDASKILRIVNAMRESISIIMVPEEVNKLYKLPIIPLKFCNESLYPVAIEIAECTESDTSSIITDWCCSVIKLYQDDDEAFKIISSRVCQGFDAAAVAKVASQMCRSDLSKMLSTLELYPQKLVDFFVSTRDYEAALSSALRSSDTEIFMKVLQETSLQMSVQFAADFIEKNPDALHLITNIALQTTERSTYSDLASKILSKINTSEEVADKKLSLAINSILHAITLEPINTALSQVTELSKFKGAESAQNMIKSHRDNVKAFEKNISTFGRTELGKPRNRVIEKLALKGMFKEALGMGEKESVWAVIIRTVINNDKKELFHKLAREIPKDLASLATSMIYNKYGKGEADSFIEQINDQKTKQKITELINSKEEPLSIKNMNSDAISGNEILKITLLEKILQ